jgi:hypothetical protein
MPTLEETIRGLQSWHFAGVQSLKMFPGRLPYGSKGSKGEKQRLLLQRWLADPKRGYSQSDFDRLIRQFRGANFALGTASMGRLLGVKDRSVRDRLVAYAIAGRWPQSRVVAEIKRRRATAPRPGQGRTVRPVDGVRDAVRRLDEQVPGWLAQLDAIVGCLGESTPMGKVVLNAQDSVKNLLKAVRSRRS